MKPTPVALIHLTCHDLSSFIQHSADISPLHCIPSSVVLAFVIHLNRSSADSSVLKTLAFSTAKIVGDLTAVMSNNQKLYFQGQAAYYSIPQQSSASE